MKRKVLRAAGFLTILLWAAALAADRFWGPLPDRTVAEGDVITCRGLGKCVLKEVSGPSKKGRTMIVIERYV